MAVPKRTGGALPVAQVETLTVANTWAANDTATVTINSRTITMTVGTTATTTQVATELAAVLGSSSSSLGTGYSATERGPNIPEFREFTAAASGSTVVLTGVTKGKPFTVTCGETTAGTGTLSTSTTTAASGSNHFTGTANWSTGAVPVDSDTVVFENTSNDLLYAIDQNGVSPASITITQSYTGKIGLRNVNADDSTYPYVEYRDKFLKMCASGDGLNTAVTIGQGDGSGSSRLKLDFNTGQVTVVVHNTGQPDETNIPSLLMKGTNTSNSYDIRKGNVGIGFFVGDSANIATLRVSYINSKESDAKVICGPGVTFSTATIVIDGGDVTLESATTGGTIVLNGGVLRILGAAHPSITINGGTLYYNSTGTITTLKVTGGTFDRSQDNRSATITNCELHDGATFNDPSGVLTITNGIDLYQCGYEDVTIRQGKHFTTTKSAV